VTPMRNRNHGFDVEVTYHDGDEDGITIRVVGEISRYYPAVMYLPNGDPGYPAEGGDIVDYKIFDKATGAEIEDSDGKILDAVLDDVMEQASEDAAGDACDAADARRDAREDR
jgi:hypothetical protein